MYSIPQNELVVNTERYQSNSLIEVLTLADIALSQWQAARAAFLAQGRAEGYRLMLAALLGEMSHD